mmetsp:Transcript_10597/g.28329  ORF Transcript_10597/g.28329 Transcript_10597/m.28329 type:complete len:279 (-) Transcript_10597:380-1216(-)
MPVARAWLSVSLAAALTIWSAGHSTEELWGSCRSSACSQDSVLLQRGGSPSMASAAEKSLRREGWNEALDAVIDITNLTSADVVVDSAEALDVPEQLPPVGTCMIWGDPHVNVFDSVNPDGDAVGASVVNIYGHGDFLDREESGHQHSGPVQCDPVERGRAVCHAGHCARWQLFAGPQVDYRGHGRSDNLGWRGHLAGLSVELCGAGRRFVGELPRVGGTHRQGRDSPSDPWRGRGLALGREGACEPVGPAPRHAHHYAAAAGGPGWTLRQLQFRRRR